MSGEVVTCGFGEPVPEMPSVGDLNRIRQRVADGLGIGGRSIPENDLDPGMCAQPFNNDLRATSGQHIETRLPLSASIRTVAYSWPRCSAKSSMPSHPRNRDRCQRDSQQGAQRDVPTSVYAQGRQQPG